MKICSVDIQGSEALFCLISLDSGLINIHDCRQSRIPLQNSEETANMRKFQFAFKKLAEDYKFDQIVIRERMKKGKFAGSADGFKIEAALQLISELKVDLISAQEIKEQLKHTPLTMDARDLGLKKYQESALQSGFAWLMKGR